MSWVRATVILVAFISPCMVHTHNLMRQGIRPCPCGGSMEARLPSASMEGESHSGLCEVFQMDPEWRETDLAEERERPDGQTGQPESWK